MNLFSSKSAVQPREKASKILRQHRQELVNDISNCTGHRKFDVHQLIDKLIQRCDALDLYGKQKDITAIAVLVTAIVSKTLRIPKNSKH